MQEFELNNKNCLDIIEWLMLKGYAWNTIRQYKHTLKKLYHEHKSISNSNLREIMKKFKYQNQRAILFVINEYCFDTGIDFKLMIPRIKVKPRKTPEIFSVEEIKLIVKSAPKPFDLALRCIFNMGAGLRVSEIIKLSWNHIRWIDWISNKDSYGIAVIKSSKGGKDRVVNIPSNLMKDIYEYAKEFKILNEFGVPVGGMIFPIGDRNYKFKLRQDSIDIWKDQFIRYSYDWFRYNIIHRHCEKALGKKIKIHSLRHSRATYLYEIEKVPIERIQLLLGHANLATTMIYTKVNPISTFELLKETEEV